MDILQFVAVQVYCTATDWLYSNNMAQCRYTRQALKTTVCYEEPPDLNLLAKTTTMKHGKRLSNGIYPVEVTISSSVYILLRSLK